MSSCMAVPPHFRAWMSDGALLLIAAVMSCKTYPLLYKIPQFNARADFKSCRISVDSGENMRIIRIYQGNVSLYYLFGGFWHMFNRISKRIASTLAALCCAVCLATPSFALIPNTGDGSGMLLPIMGGLLVVSVILIMIYVGTVRKEEKSSNLGTIFTTFPDCGKVFLYTFSSCFCMNRFCTFHTLLMQYFKAHLWKSWKFFRCLVNNHAECYNQNLTLSQKGAPMLTNLKRIVVVVGHYGSGKTNFSVNLAVDLKAAGTGRDPRRPRYCKPLFPQRRFRRAAGGEGDRADRARLRAVPTSTCPPLTGAWMPSSNRIRRW